MIERIHRWIKKLLELEQPGYQQGRWGSAFVPRDVLWAIDVALDARKRRREKRTATGGDLRRTRTKNE